MPHHHTPAHHEQDIVSVVRVERASEADVATAFSRSQTAHTNLHTS